MNLQKYKEKRGESRHSRLYVSGKVILYSIYDLEKQTGWGLAALQRLFKDPDFPSIDYGKRKLVENHALMQFFSARRDEVNRYSFKLNRDPWEDIIYNDGLYSNLRADYIDRCMRVDALQLDWMDALTAYTSPEVVLFTKEDLLEQSNWTEEEVRMLFRDFRFPRTEFAKKNVCEVHALIQFFARKEIEKQKQLADQERREEAIAHLRRMRSGG